MTTRVNRFIVLQNLINDQIDNDGIADLDLANELDVVGAELDIDEMYDVINYYDNQL